MTASQHRIARLEQLLERVRRNAAAPRVRTNLVTPTSAPVVRTPRQPEPLELSDDDLIAVVSDVPEPDETIGPARAAAEGLPEQPAAPERADDAEQAAPVSEPRERRTPPAPISMQDLPPVLSLPAGPRPVEVDATLRPPAPARLPPLPINLVSDLPSEASWRPSAPDDLNTDRPALASSVPTKELGEGEESGIEVPVLTPPPESGHQLLPESPRAWTATPGQGPGKLELVEEEEEVEAESVPPSGPKVAEAYSLPPGTEQFVQHVELEDNLGDDLELEELPEPPRAATTLMSPPSTPVGEDLAEPGLQEAHVVEGLAVEVTRRPDVPSGTAPAAITNLHDDFVPRTFLELLDASLKLGMKG